MKVSKKNNVQEVYEKIVFLKMGQNNDVQINQKKELIIEHDFKNNKIEQNNEKTNDYRESLVIHLLYQVHDNEIQKPSQKNLQNMINQDIKELLI